MPSRGVRAAAFAIAVLASGCVATKPYVRTEVEQSAARTQQQLDVVDHRLDAMEREIDEEKARLGGVEADVRQVRTAVQETAKKADQAMELVIKAGPRTEAALSPAAPTTSGAPPPKPAEPVAAAPETLVVHFPAGQWQLDNPARSALLKALKRLRENPSVAVKLEGHADSVGSPSQNLELSQRRADEVRRFLVGNGIKRHRIEVLAMGEARPIASNRSPAGRDQNRRVAITLFTPAK
jgi:outer membrane protein OmpA-like peptidoglycan-associated protein